jgi:hypothetical protein
MSNLKGMGKSIKTRRYDDLVCSETSANALARSRFRCNHLGLRVESHRSDPGLHSSVRGYLDDLIIVPVSVWLLIRMVPDQVLTDSRTQADEWFRQGEREAYEPFGPCHHLGSLVLCSLGHLQGHFLMPRQNPTERLLRVESRHLHMCDNSID